MSEQPEDEEPATRTPALEPGTLPSHPLRAQDVPALLSKDID